MKIDKKTLFQYIFLAFLVVGVAYYYFFYAPIEKRISDLESEKTVKEQELQTKQMQALKERGLDDQILAANKSIEEIDRRIFVDLSQAEALMILTELNQKGRLVFDAVQLSENVASIDTAEFRDVDLRLDYMGDYYDVMTFMRGIRKYEKNISLLNASFEVSKFRALEEIEAEYSEEAAQAYEQNYLTLNGGEAEEGFEDEAVEDSGEEQGGESGETSGEESEDVASNTKKRPKIANLMVNMSLRYTSVPRLAELGWKDRELIRSIKSQRELAKGPFNIYPDYLQAIRVQKDAERREQEIAKQSSAIADIGKEIDKQEPSKQRTLRHSFEDGTYFFVGSDKKMDGEISNSVVAKNGIYSADFKFDYMFLRPVNSASLVFTKPQMLYSPAESIVLQVYSYEFSGHEIGVVIKDSMRKEHKVVLSPSVDWVEWKELSADLPQEIAYPCLIQRIYVEGKGREQRRMGRFLFDQLELEYPAEEEKESQRN